jgi:glycosyltransferase involved in cell wall biosynthesis
MLYVYPAKMRGVGLDLVVAQQLQALSEGGHRVDFLSRGRYASDGVRSIRIPYTAANALSFLHAPYYYDLQNRFFSMIGSWLLCWRQYEVIVSWARSAGRCFRRAARAGVCSFLNVGTLHHNFPVGAASWIPRPWPALQQRELSEEYRLADTILVASEFARATFLANQVDPSKVLDIGRGADTSRFQPAGRTDGVFRVVFFGRLSERKGVRQLLEAWKLAALPQAELWLIGDIPNRMEETLAPLRGPNCRLFGFRTDPETLLPQCDVQVLLTEKEGMPKALIEGAACGLITITTEEAGFPVETGRTGYLVRRDQPAEVARLLRLLAEQPALRRQMSEASRRFIERHLTWEAFRRRFLQAIESRYQSKAASFRPSTTETLP